MWAESEMNEERDIEREGSSAEAWPQVKAEFAKALALRSEIRRAGWFN